jgi:hypothetical protein
MMDPIRTLVDIPRYHAAKSPNAIALSFEGAKPPTASLTNSPAALPTD